MNIQDAKVEAFAFGEYLLKNIIFGLNLKINNDLEVEIILKISHVKVAALAFGGYLLVTII